VCRGERAGRGDTVLPSARYASLIQDGGPLGPLYRPPGAPPLRHVFEDGEKVRLLDVDPGLGTGLDARSAEQARMRLVVPAARLEPGEWELESLLVDPDGHVGLLVVDGLLIRDVAIGETSCAELIGEGDVLRPWEDIGAAAPVPSKVRWRVLEPTTLALIERRVISAGAAWPEVVTALINRAVARAQTLAVALAISCITGLKVRLLVLLWHLADRFGTVGPTGVSVPVPLTHEVVARLVGATRPSVSTALKELADEGLATRRSGGGFMLHGEPPEMAQVLASRRVAGRRARSEGAHAQ
jgi:CRP/FNR family transcriptional regulator, cyclic AMP receptor protein